MFKFLINVCTNEIIISGESKKNQNSEFIYAIGQLDPKKQINIKFCCNLYEVPIVFILILRKIKTNQKKVNVCLFAFNSITEYNTPSINYFKDFGFYLNKNLFLID